MNSAPALPSRDAISALILAAGTGDRLGGRSKASLQHKGQPLLQHSLTLAKLVADEVLVGLHADDIGSSQNLVDAAGGLVVEGGATRHETLTKLIFTATKPFILILEVARPFSSEDHCLAVLEKAASEGVAALSYPPKPRDSLGREKEGKLTALFPREEIVQIETPIACRTDWLKAALESFDPHVQNTQSSLAPLIAAGHPISLVSIGEENIKITHEEDLALLSP